MSKWRLKKTLARKREFRPIEAEDMRFIFAAYRKGSLASLGRDWGNGELLDVDQFKVEFQREVVENYHAAWTLFGETRKGFIPIGVVLAFASHPNTQIAPFMIIGDMIWMPWATPRMRLEAAVHFFNGIRDEIPLMEYASEKHKRFFEVICNHGIMRRIGTSYTVYKGEPVAVFETRSRAR